MDDINCQVEMTRDMVPFSQKTLTPEWARKVVEELGETPEKKEKALKEFRKLVKEQKDLRCRTDDIFLLRFIRLKKYDLHKALTLCRNYYRVRHRIRDWGQIPGFSPADAIAVLPFTGICVAPYRLPWGAHVGVVKLGNFDWSKATFDDLIKMSCFVGELVLELEATQLFGACLIIDLADVSLSDYRHFITLSSLSFLIRHMQDSWPQKIDSVHILNEPFFVSPAVQLIQHIIKKKNKERLNFHGNDMKSLHKLVPPKYLPEEFGGSLGPLDYRTFYQYFAEQAPFFEMICNYGFAEKIHS